MDLLTVYKGMQKRAGVLAGTLVDPGATLAPPMSRPRQGSVTFVLPPEDKRILHAPKAHLVEDFKGNKAPWYQGIAPGGMTGGGISYLTAGVGGTALRLAGANILGSAPAALGTMAAGIVPAAASNLAKSELARRQAEAADRRSVAKQQDTLNFYDKTYAPWQKQYYEAKGYEQVPTGQVHPATGKPVFNWQPKTK